jgi:hypothetical protein
MIECSDQFPVVELDTDYFSEMISDRYYRTQTYTSHHEISDLNVLDGSVTD